MSDIRNSKTLPERIDSLVCVCCGYGADISQHLKKLQSAGIEDIAISPLETSYRQVEEEIRFIADSAVHLAEGLLLHLHRLLQELEECLHSTCSMLEMYSSNLKSLANATSGRSMELTQHLLESLELAEHRLELWHNSFVQRLLVIILLGEPFSKATPTSVRSRTGGSKALQDIFNIRQTVLQTRSVQIHKSMEMTTVAEPHDRLPDSQIWISNDLVKYPFVIEYKDIDDAVDISLLKESVRALMMVLAQDVPGRMGILRGAGFTYVTSQKRKRFELVYEFPPGTEKPRTLRNLLLDEVNYSKGPLHSISDRFDLARQLASAILYVHTTMNVHKSVRPETILIFESKGSKRAQNYPFAIGGAYLVGFEGLRKDGPYSTRTGDGEWYKDIYRHPTRQGLDPKKVYDMRHDIYSLGVVFLEIALWQSFLTWGHNSEYMPNSALRNTFMKHHTAAGGQDWSKTQKNHSEDIRLSFIKMARQQVPLTMGTKFADIVIRCLGCCDGEFLALDDNKSEDQVHIGINYIETVLEKLEAIVI